MFNIQEELKKLPGKPGVYLTVSYTHLDRRDCFLRVHCNFTPCKKAKSKKSQKTEKP